MKEILTNAFIKNGEIFLNVKFLKLILNIIIDLLYFTAINNFIKNLNKN